MIFVYFVVGIYALSLLLIFFYALAQLNLLFNYLKAKKNHREGEKFNFNNPEEIPFVTIQLPVYNELYVMQRLLDNIVEIDYPSEKLQIQVLDDSTDESFESTAIHIKELQNRGINIQHISRKNRTGFKAGALKEGLKTATGEFIAIFDSDFLPKKDWLQKTIPYFKDEKIGVVQTRWGHINRDYSLLTKIQAFALDFHFILEQTGRNFGNHFINFNGTAGVWRKSCILDAGNWQGDTLTEDLDLSYRAQLKNWKFKYLEDVETPAELPVVISAAKSQQFRWNKGAAENFQKNYFSILKDSEISWRTKFHSFFHLLNSSMFILILMIAVLSVPMLYIKAKNPELKYLFYVLATFALSTLIFFVCYWITFSRIHGGGWKNFIRYIGMFFTFFSVAMGFSVHNSLAVLEGHFGKKSEFIRTPKFNVGSFKETWKSNKYLTHQFSAITIIEGFLMLYFAFGMFSAFTVGNTGGDFGLFPFHLMLFIGFGFVFFSSLKPLK
ncbi:cellulose synthase family protein [Aequorivita echinoideorum]|uniref:Glycosyltransferase family 2 protein n=1 Tax=Aequorivita echinoideorum TaxID=1549647 RepID=A0ABS5S510_9FLAO|nr:cellulose synthase family protein [Aequorivita echinoideorum]MBT0607452.1 glycosyltransferase family 2 protein [Aequorivita echinoideorum]